MKYFLHLSFFLILGMGVSAQTGPGGIGNSDNNVLWLKVDGDVDIANDRISTLYDMSGRDNHATQTIVGQRPAIGTGGRNGKPYIDFQGIWEYLVIPDKGYSTGLDSISNLTMYTMIVPTDVKNSNAEADAQAILSRRNPNASSPWNSSSYSFLFWNNRQYMADINGDTHRNNNRTPAGTITEDAPHILGTIFEGQSSTNSQARTSHWINGSFSRRGNEGANESMIARNEWPLTIGALDSSATAQYKLLEGQVYEIIMFSDSLNKTQRTILTNYLSSKYDVNIGSRDRYAHDAFGTGNWFGNDVAGIGLESAAGNDKHVFGFSDILGVGNPSQMIGSEDIGNYLLFGHNGREKSDLESTIIGQSDVKRMRRTWRLDETQSNSQVNPTGVGTVSFFVKADEMPPLPSGLTSYAVLVASSSTFQNNLTVYELALDSNGLYYQADDISFEDGDYVTIGAFRPELRFTHPVASTFENQGPAQIEVSLNYVPAFDVTVDYFTTAGSANPGTDPIVFGDPNNAYQLQCFTEAEQIAFFGSHLYVKEDYADTSGTLTFLPGEQTKNIYVTIWDNGCFDGTRNFEVTLDNVSPSSVDIVIDNQLHNILDDDDGRLMQFTTDSSFVTEGDITYLEVEIILTDPAGGPIEVDIYNVISSTTAVLGVDYDFDHSYTTQAFAGEFLHTATVTIPAGDTVFNFRVEIIDNDIFQLEEYLTIKMDAPTIGARIKTDNTSFDYAKHVIRIDDNDPFPVVSFVADTSSGCECLANPQFELTMDRRASVPIEVNWYASDISARRTGTKLDYYISGTSTLRFEPGDTTTFIEEIIVIDNTKEEPNRWIDISLIDDAQYATIGAIDTHRYTIIDDDVWGITGPGGVGDSIYNIVWLAADALNLNDGDAVSAWLDKSGNDNAAVNNNGNQPVYRPAGTFFNDKPYIEFNGSASPLEIPNNQIFDFLTETTIYAIVQPNASSQSDLVPIVSKRVNHNSQNAYSMFFNSRRFVSDFNSDNQRRESNQQFNLSELNSPQMLSTSYKGSNVGADRNEMRIDGAEIAYRNNPNYSEPYIVNTSAPFRIGQLTGNTTLARMDIAEVLVFRSALNEARKRIVENYLSAKYGISISNNYFQYETSHSFEVAGIGRVSETSLHNNARGSAILTIGMPQNLEDGEFMIWGHDNAGYSNDTLDVPALVSERIEQVWRVSTSKEGAFGSANIGTVRATFDVEEITLLPDHEYVLLINNDFDNDPTFTNAFVQSNGVFNPTTGQVQFNNTNFSDGDAFTLGQAQITPLPVELIAFDAVKEGTAVNVYWATATEIDSDYFIVERSANAEDYKAIQVVEAAGNSVEEIFYQIKDEDPYSGVNYYRLKQVDFDGSHEYFGPVYVVFGDKSDKFAFSVFPNPVKDHKINIYLSGCSGKTYQVLLSDNSGRSWNIGEVKCTDSKRETLTVNREIPSGVYNLLMIDEDRKTYGYQIIIK
ncbi:MAG: hypothetical protein EA412_06765 [Chitinophagaceae bacterium]|nr:MAG: hypothetical protein EA412_06765 [Chitinophagaceae bacterium]